MNIPFIHKIYGKNEVKVVDQGNGTPPLKHYFAEYPLPLAGINLSMLKPIYQHDNQDTANQDLAL